MSNLNPVKAALAPYLLYLKLALLAALFLGGTFTGCKLQEGKVEKAQAAVLFYKGQSEANASALNAANKQALANKKVADKEKAARVKSTAAGEREKAENDKELQLWAEEVDRLKKDPDCKAIMEMKLCKSITSF